jgi:hypothetical protein
VNPGTCQSTLSKVMEILVFCCISVETSRSRKSGDEDVDAALIDDLPNAKFILLLKLTYSFSQQI